MEPKDSRQTNATAVIDTRESRAVKTWPCTHLTRRVDMEVWD
jgi:hypothetical protein